MTCSGIYWLGIALGIIAGMFLHGLILQLAYKMGIVEYKGLKK